MTVILEVRHVYMWTNGKQKELIRREKAGVLRKFGTVVSVKVSAVCTPYDDYTILGV